MVDNSQSIGSKSYLELDRVWGTFVRNSNQFEIQGDLIAYIVSGGVVVSKFRQTTNEIINQRFFIGNSNLKSSQNDDSANAYLNLYDPLYSQEEQKDAFGFSIKASPIIVQGNSNIDTEPIQGTKIQSSPSSPSKLKHRVRSINCIALSPNGKLLAIGECGYQPRILLYSLAPNSSSTPVVLLYDHSFGISMLKFSNDSKHLCSLGLLNDGVLNIWRINGTSIYISSTNRCSSVINDIVWHNNYLITIGARLIKVWTIEESGQKPLTGKVLKGKNVILGNYLNSNFTCGSILNDQELLITTDNKLLLLKLHENFKLVSLKCPEFEFCSVYVDKTKGKIWFCSKDYQINCIDIKSLEEIEDVNISSLELASSPTRTDRTNLKDFKILPVNDENLLFLSERGSLDLFHKSTRTSTTLVGALLKDLMGVKSYKGKLISFTSEGEVNELILPNTVGPLFDHKLVQSNSLTAIGLGENEIVLGDKIGFIYCFEEEGKTSKKTSEKTKEGAEKEAKKEVTHKLTFQIRAHESTVTDIIIFYIEQKQYLCSISRDRMIQVFVKSNEWDLLYTIPLHNGVLLKVEYCNSRIFVCSSDRTISIHKLEDNQIKLEKSIPLKASPITMKIIDNQLIVSTNDKNLLIYDLVSLEFQRTLKLMDDKINESLLIENFTVFNDILITSCSDKSLRTFNFINGKPLSVNYGHIDPISYLDRDGDKLITIGSDGCLFSWNIKTGTPNKDSNTLLGSKVIRKIIPTSPIRRDETTSSTSPSPSPSSSPTVRLTKATLKRIERSRSISPMRQDTTTIPRTIRPLSDSKRPSLGSFPATSNKFDRIMNDILMINKTIMNNELKPLQKSQLQNELIKTLQLLDMNDLLETYSDKLVTLVESKLNANK